MPSRALVGFGLWHLVDAILNHWVLQIHHVRQDSSDVLAWDIGWLFVFDVLPGLAGACIARRGGGDDDEGGESRDATQPGKGARARRSLSGGAALGLLCATALMLALVAARAPRGNTPLLIALPSASSAQILDRLRSLTRACCGQAARVRCGQSVSRIRRGTTTVCVYSAPCSCYAAPWCLRLRAVVKRHGVPSRTTGRVVAQYGRNFPSLVITLYLSRIHRTRLVLTGT
jgi:Predicted membrane protein (DUF2243)